MRRVLRIAATATALVGAALAVSILVATDPAQASEMAAVAAEPASLPEVINNIRNWLVTLLVALATLLLTVGGVRYLLAGCDPGETAKAKDTLKYAALGYAIAALAPLLTSILKQIVGA